MTEAFIVWCAVSALIFAMGVFCLVSKKPVKFWANTQMFEVSDVFAYNRALAKLWFSYGTAILLCRLPLLFEDNDIWVILGAVMGTMLSTIALIIGYLTVIERKYKKR